MGLYQIKSRKKKMILDTLKVRRWDNIRQNQGEVRFDNVR